MFSLRCSFVCSNNMDCYREYVAARWWDFSSSKERLLNYMVSKRIYTRKRIIPKT